MGAKAKLKRRLKPLVEIDPSPRDYAMARLAAARASAQSTIEAIDEALIFFIDCDDDDDGKERVELIATALESAGCIARALESAEEVMDQVDMEESEPWDEGDDDEEKEDDDVEGAD